MGAVLLAGGANQKRFTLPNSTVLVHQAAGGLEGTATDIEIRAKEILRLQQRIKEILAFHTGQDMDRIARDMDRDFFMSAEAAKDYGLVDDIIGRTRLRSSAVPGCERWTAYCAATGHSTPNAARY